MRPGVQLAAASVPCPIPIDAAPDAPPDIVAAMTRELCTDIAHIGPKLGLAIVRPGNLLYPKIELTISDTDGGKTLMNTDAVQNALFYQPCVMTAFKNSWQGQPVTSSGGVSPLLHVLMTHEVVHCYQHVVWGSRPVVEAIPPWIEEGTAMYLAADDTGIAEPRSPASGRAATSFPRARSRTAPTTRSATTRCSPMKDATCGA